ncbi:hypothetical protein PQX77_004502, partial [Marasmius sp. AFHP31]
MATIATTILSRSTSTIISHLTRFKATHYDPARHSLFFTLSPPSSNEDLASLVNSLTSFSEKNVGCISSSEQSHSQDVITCSVALLDNSNTSLFRSTIPGREMTQVGRWHAYAQKDNKPRLTERELDTLGWSPSANGRVSGGGGVDWEVVWDKTTHNEEVYETLPEEMKGVKPDTVSQILYLSDQSPEGLVSILRTRFPTASQLGLIASSTPFITGRPVTLFHNGKIYEDGAVGISFTSDKPLSLSLQLPEDVTPLGEEMIVTRAEGNLINTLDNSNPTRLLLRAIQTAGIDSTSEAAILFKEEEEFYLGVLQNHKITQIFGVMSGDTSRGTIALNTTRAPPLGAKVRFFHRTKRAAGTATSSPSVLATKPTAFFKVAKPEELQRAGDGLPTDPVILENTFFAASENGFMVARGGESGEVPWTCRVP